MMDACRIKKKRYSALYKERLEAIYLLARPKANFFRDAAHMTNKFPKYLRDLNEGTVENIEVMYGPEPDQGTTNFLYRVTANLGNMRAFIYSEDRYEIGSSINLKNEQPYEIEMVKEVSFNRLQPLLERFGRFHILSNEELAEKELSEDAYCLWTYKTNNLAPIVIETYIAAIIETMRYCVEVTEEDESIFLATSDDTYTSTPKNLYDLGVLHAQLQLELNRGEAIKSGDKVVKNQDMGRLKSRETKATNKAEVETRIKTLVESNVKLGKIVLHNRRAAARMIIDLNSFGYLPAERVIAETYLPAMYPKTK